MTSLNTKSTLAEILAAHPEITATPLNQRFVEIAWKGKAKGTYRVETSDRTYHVARRYNYDTERHTRVGDYALEAIEWLCPEIIQIEI